MTNNNLTPVTTYPTHPHHRTNFLRRTLTIFIATIIIFGIIVFVMYLILRPHPPKFRLQTLTLTNFNITSNSMISGTWTIALTVRNPNSKITIHYDHIQAAVFHKSKSIAVTNVAPFEQGKRNETSVRVTVVSVSEYFDGDGIGREMGEGVVEFGLRVVGRVKFKASGWWTRRRILGVYCSGLGVRVEGNGTGELVSGGGKECN